MTKDECQALYEAIDSVADARSFLAVVVHQWGKDEVEPTDPRFDSALKQVQRAQDQLRNALKPLAT